MLYPASTSSTVHRSPTPKNLVGLPPPVPQGDARQDARAQEQSGGGRQDHTRTAEPRTTGLGIGCVLSILDGCGAFIMMVPYTGLGRSFLLDLLYGRLDHFGRPFSFYLGLSPDRCLGLFRDFLLLRKSTGREKEHSHKRTYSPSH